MRLEGLRVEGDASGGQLVAQALGEVLQLAGGGDAEPERRVARAAELAQTVARQHDGGRVRAHGVERVARAGRLRLVDLAEEGEREVVGRARQEAALHGGSQLAGERGDVVGEVRRQVERDERPHEVSFPGSSSGVSGPFASTSTRRVARESVV